MTSDGCEAQREDGSERPSKGGTWPFKWSAGGPGDAFTASICKHTFSSTQQPCRANHGRPDWGSFKRRGDGAETQRAACDTRVGRALCETQAANIHRLGSGMDERAPRRCAVVVPACCALCCSANGDGANLGESAGDGAGKAWRRRLLG